MTTYQTSTSETSDRTDPSWSGFRDLCKKIEGISPIPFCIVDGHEQVIYQSKSPPNEQAETTLTMLCRHRQKTFFRIICEADEKAPQGVLNLMFALKKIGLYYRTSAEDRESIYEEIARNYRFLHFFYTLPALLSRALPQNRLCQISLDRICKIMNVERGSIFLRNPRTRTLQLVALHGKSLLNTRHVAMNSRILESVQTKNRALLIEDVDRYPDFKGKGHYRTGSFLSAPIYYHPSVQQKRLAGVINLADPVGRPFFTSHDMKFVSAAAGYAVFIAMTKPK